MLDGTFLLAVKQELEPLKGSRIDKIYQPSGDEIILALRGTAGSRRIMICTSGTAGRIHLTETKAENPKAPPMFCMLLRKHLSGGRLTGIRQEGLERILYLDFDTVNELGDREILTVTVEIMGRYSNLILVHENGKIIDALHRLDDITAQRLILPGVTYKPPERRERLNFLICTKDEMIRAIGGINSGSAAKGLIGIFEGISPILAREWIFTACGENDIPAAELTDTLAERIADAAKATADRFLSNERHYIKLTDNSSPKDLCFEDIHQYDGIYEKEYFGTAWELLDSFYSGSSAKLRMRQRYSELYKLIGNLCTRTAHRLENRRAELSECSGKDTYKLYGDLISANLYRVEKGDSELVCDNFYEEGAPKVTIRLDRRLTPSENMQRMYRQYKRAANAEKMLASLISEDEDEYSYLQSVLGVAERASSEAEIDALRQELSEQGYIRSRGKKEKPVKLAPMEYTSPDGFTVLVGRNNKQNDELTHRLAEKTDLWLHTKNIPGSHVIIRTNGEQVPDSTILYAARLAAYHSSARGSSQVPVDYVTAKFVKKPAGAKPGMVIFTNNRTVYVTGAEE